MQAEGMVEDAKAQFKGQNSKNNAILEALRAFKPIVEKVEKALSARQPERMSQQTPIVASSQDQNAIRMNIPVKEPSTLDQKTTDSPSIAIKPAQKISDKSSQSENIKDKVKQAIHSLSKSKTNPPNSIKKKPEGPEHNKNVSENKPSPSQAPKPVNPAITKSFAGAPTSHTEDSCISDELLRGETQEHARETCKKLKLKLAHVNTSAQVDSLNQVEADKSKKTIIKAEDLELDSDEDSEQDELVKKEIKKATALLNASKMIDKDAKDKKKEAKITYEVPTPKVAKKETEISSKDSLSLPKIAKQVP